MVSKVLTLATENEIKRLEEDPEKLQHLVLLMQDWLRYQTHLPQNYSKLLLTNFVRGCKMDLEKAKKKFEICCYLPFTHQKIYGNRRKTIDNDVEQLEYVHHCVIPTLTTEGYRIIFSKAVNFEKCDVVALIRVRVMIAELILYHDPLCTGEILVVDFEHVTPQFYSKLFIPTLFQLAKIVVDSYPTQVKKIFVLSCHSLLEKGISLVKLVLPPKLRDRVYLLNNSKDIIKHIPIESLPSDYNGSLPSMAILNQSLKEFYLKNKDIFIEIGEMRPTGPIPKHIQICDESLGVDGSFRKMNID